MPTDRCPTCDREECDRPAAADATAGIPGFGEDCTDEDNAKWSRLGFAVRNCLAHAVTADQWRARALAAEADKSCRVCDRVDAMTYACEPSWEKTRAAAARWRKVAPLIERLADDVRRRELIARAEFDRRIIDTVTNLLAATRETTP